MAARIAWVVGGMLVFWVVALAVYLVVGVSIPWVAFGCITLLAVVLSVASQSDSFD